MADVIAFVIIGYLSRADRYLYKYIITSVGTVISVDSLVNVKLCIQHKYNYQNVKQVREIKPFPTFVDIVLNAYRFQFKLN